MHNKNMPNYSMFKIQKHEELNMKELYDEEN